MDDTPAAPSDVLVLTLAPDNPTNTSITNAGDVLYTVVTDHLKRSTWTQVRDADDEVIGSLEWRDVLADRVRIGDRKLMSLWDWLRKSPVPFKDQAVFMDERGRKYKWKGLSPGLSLQLFSEDDGYRSPIARYARSRSIYIPARLPLQGVLSSAPSMLSLSPTLTDKDADARSIAPTLASIDVQSVAPTLVDKDESRTVLSPVRTAKQRTPATLLLSPRATEIQDLVVLSFLFLEKYHRTKESGAANSNSFPGYVGMHGC